MSNSYVGEIRTFGFGFPPRGMASCNGATLSIAQNQVLFSLLGVTYGGNGTTTFNLPDLRGRVPVSIGQAPGLSPYLLGQLGGTETVTLTTQQMPMHNHSFDGSSSKFNAITEKATVQIATDGSRLARGVDGAGTAQPEIYRPAGTSDTNVALGGLNVAGTVGAAGGSQPHPNLQPYLAVNFCIQLQGIYPSRN